MISVPIYFITNRTLASEEKYFEVIKKVSNYRNIKIILREKGLKDEEYKKLYYKVKELSPNTEIIINSKLNVFKEVNERTIQLSFKDFMSLEEFDYNVGVSVHTVEEGILAYRKGAKYLLASHIFETKCKVGLEPKGVEFISEIRKYVKCDIIALGGINLENYIKVIESGANGIAVMSLFYNDYNFNKLMGT
ncbi:thiamine phosphate synthase [Clostridium sp.]|uniref:thiamine phosphate synthase n=1 Tax=Clostridium sp. TaxID=1506 RepID=UPI0025C2379B|nr:thiamine phosphate synthase [Clostridium sp.]